MKLMYLKNCVVALSNNNTIKRETYIAMKSNYSEIPLYIDEENFSPNHYDENYWKTVVAYYPFEDCPKLNLPLLPPIPTLKNIATKRCKEIFKEYFVREAHATFNDKNILGALISAYRAGYLLSEDELIKPKEFLPLNKWEGLDMDIEHFLVTDKKGDLYILGEYK